MNIYGGGNRFFIFELHDNRSKLLIVLKLHSGIWFGLVCLSLTGTVIKLNYSYPLIEQSRMDYYRHLILFWIWKKKSSRGSVSFVTVHFFLWHFLLNLRKPFSSPISIIASDCFLSEFHHKYIPSQNLICPFTQPL